MTAAPGTGAAREEALLRLARQRRADARKIAAPAAPAAPVEPAGAAGPPPLSYAQRRMWLMDRLGRSGAAYHVPFATRVRGPFSPDALGRALSGLVRRHEVLRTRYGQRDGEPYQEVMPAAPVPVDVVTDPGDPEHLLRQAAAVPFDLAAGPVLRALVLRHGPEDHTVLLTFHHVAVDGWSLGVVTRELSALYRAELDGPAPEGGTAPEGGRGPRDPDGLLGGPAPRYAEFARREQAAAAGLAAGLEHWLRRLSGARPVPLPAPRAASAPGHRGRSGVVGEPLAPEVLDQLRAVARKHRTTLFTVTLAGAYAALLETTGAEDLVLGCAVGNRDRPGLRGLVGLCVNTLAVRVDTTGAAHFGALLDRVRDALLEAHEHREVPFDLVVERLGAAGRDRDGHPLVDVTADVLRAPVTLELAGARTEAVDIDLGTAKFGLGFYVEEAHGEDGPRCLVQYDLARLDEPAARDLLRRFTGLLTAVAADPAHPLTRPVPPAPAALHPAQAWLLERPEVARAAVLERPGQPPLAYVVPSGLGSAEPVGLRIALRSALRPELVPATVTVLDALPRAADGSVDRARLPGAPPADGVAGPAAGDGTSGGDGTGGGGGTSGTTGARARAVLDAFGELLGQEPAPDADFFALGGHSLLAVRLADRLRERLRLPLTGLDVMEHRSPRALSALLEERARQRTAAAARHGARRSASRTDTVLVTGATGGVGAFVLRELAARGRPVRALARPESAHLLAADGVEVVHGDLGDPAGLRAATADASAVIHAACTFTDPEVDLAAMRALLDGWRQGPFVFVSSVDAYGQPPLTDVAEDTPSAEPLTPYGRAKLDCERMLREAAGRAGRGGASAVRAPIVWGPHARLRDQLRWGATGALFQAAKAGRPIELPDPARGWYGAPWVHAAALARALVRCVDRPAGGVVNAVAGHVGWAEFATELVRLLDGAGGVRFTTSPHPDPAPAPDPRPAADAGTGPAVPPGLLHRRRYRAGTLAAELAERPGEDWRSAIAATLAC
ncbi:condensation domain-containing protein [Streptomyces sp. MST-110588]|uniref:condensation domain-containing protein n=1 Tax=Streptomyces sp. MST-110588 TaxID=2833628 RepID=UPI001F5E1388|nr:condensation domain-containing protein [Streptomyces sp. MST-110588]UNO38593.1 NAD-dependent epimerase/dehydratase family protein [Streptomyces sp. MST-110588]